MCYHLYNNCIHTYRYAYTCVDYLQMDQTQDVLFVTNGQEVRDLDV